MNYNEKEKKPQSIGELIKKIGDSKPATFEDYFLTDLQNQFGNSDKRTCRNLTKIVNLAVKSNKVDDVRQIASEVKSDSNESTKDKTAVFVDRCFKHFKEIKSNSYTPEQKWLLKSEKLSEDQSLVNLNHLQNFGRYENLTENTKSLKFNNATITVKFFLQELKIDTPAVVDLLKKPYGKLEKLLEIVIIREFWMRLQKSKSECYSQEEKGEKLAIFEDSDDRDPNYMTITLLKLRELVFGSTKGGKVKDLEQAMVRMSHEYIGIKTDKEFSYYDTDIKLKTDYEFFNPIKFSFLTIDAKNKFSKQKIKAVRIKIDPYFYKIYARPHKDFVINDDIDLLRTLSDREITLYHEILPFMWLKNGYLSINTELYEKLGIRSSRNHHKKMLLERAIKGLEKKASLKIKLDNKNKKLFWEFKE